MDTRHSGCDGIVVWTDDRHSGMKSQNDACGFDVTLRTEFPARAGTWGEMEPATSGDWAVWVDSRHGDDADIYGAGLAGEGGHLEWRRRQI